MVKAGSALLESRCHDDDAELLGECLMGLCEFTRDGGCEIEIVRILRDAKILGGEKLLSTDDLGAFRSGFADGFLGFLDVHSGALGLLSAEAMRYVAWGQCRSSQSKFQADTGSELIFIHLDQCG